MPAVSLAPGRELPLLLLRQPLLPLGDGLVVTLGERLWGREGPVAASGDGAAAESLHSAAALRPPFAVAAKAGTQLLGL